jgi:molybdate transport system substrate-binding protein
MAMQSVVTALAQLGVAGVLMLGAAQAAEIKVLGSPGTKEPYTLLAPEFEKASGHKVVTTWDGVNNVHKRISDGQIFDVVMVPVAQTDDLIKQGKLLADTRVVVATSGVGVAIRAGAPKIELTADGLKKALLNAKAIAYSTGPSGVHVARLIEKWGITEQVRGKIVPPRTGTPIGEVVARGDADIGFQQVSELLPVKGIDFLGALPGDLNEITAFAAAVHKAASVPDAGKALLKFLTAPAAAPIIRKTGMEPG